jgi:hypothetical protein
VYGCTLGALKGVLSQITATNRSRPVDRNESDGYKIASQKTALALVNSTQQNTQSSEGILVINFTMLQTFDLQSPTFLYDSSCKTSITIFHVFSFHSSA